MMGIPGAVIGYCQALFTPRGTAENHTREMAETLQQMGAPWFGSHELFWGHRNVNSTPEEYIRGASRPLLGWGRIPILITGLDAGKDHSEIESILESRPQVFPGETALLRIVLSDQGSVESAVELIESLTVRAFADRAMPAWWPLLQGTIEADLWQRLAGKLGDKWKFTNVAVNPFTVDQIDDDLLRPQITVAQVPVGHASGVSKAGTIALAPGMSIAGAFPNDRYCIDEYMERISKLEDVPTLIVLGPSLPEWSWETNAQRIRALVPHLRRGCQLLWRAMPEARREMVWSLSA